MKNSYVFRTIFRYPRLLLATLTVVLLALGMFIHWRHGAEQTSLKNVFPLECDRDSTYNAPPVLSQHLEKEPPHTSPPPTAQWTATAGENTRTKRILMLGFDRSNSRLVGRTDAILIAEISPSKKRIGIISIPRDLWVPIWEDESGRINKVYRVGNRRYGRGGGHTLLKNVIKEQLGIAIDHTIAVDFSGFEHLIDILGGIDVSVLCPIRDNFISDTAPGGYEPLAFDAGMQHMTGREALLFSRSRHGRTDMDRSRRQQAVLMGIKNKLLSNDIFFRLPQILADIEQYVNTDISLMEALRLAKYLKKVNGQPIHRLVLKPPVVNRRQTEDGKSVVVLDKEAYTKKMKRLYRSSAGTQHKPVKCRPVDVALNWKQRNRSTPLPILEITSNNQEVPSSDTDS